MSVTPSSTVVGVFRDRSMADQAVNALQDAGFAGDQIQYVSSSSSGSFLEGLKSLFTGTNDSGGNLTDDLTGMGLSDAEAEYYSNEYNNGHTILVVRAAERGTEAMNILRQYGAYNADMGSGFSNETAATSQQPPAYAQQSSQSVSGQYKDAQDWGTSPQPQAAVAYPSPTPQQDNTVPEQDVDEEDTQPIAPVNQAQDTPANVVTPQPDTGYQASQAGTAYNEQSSELPPSQAVVATPRDDRDYQAASEVAPTYNTNDQSTQATPSTYESTQASVTNDQSVPPPPPGYETGTPYTQGSTAAPGTDVNVQSTQTGGTTRDQTYAQPVSPSATMYDTQPQTIQPGPMTSSQETGTQPSQTSVATPEQTDDLEQLQAQLQSLQQQLQETKARLQAARERENQVKAARERQQQVQAARQQIQDLQAELQATMAELQDVQSRLAQYQ